MSKFLLVQSVGEERLSSGLISWFARTDAHSLYGFGTHDERAEFRSLIKISGRRRNRVGVLSGIQCRGPLRVVFRTGHCCVTRCRIGTKDRRSVWHGGGVKDRSGPPSELWSTRSQAHWRQPEAEALGAPWPLGIKPAEATRCLQGRGSRYTLP